MKQSLTGHKKLQTSHEQDMEKEQKVKQVLNLCI